MADDGEVSGRERGTVGRRRRGGCMVYIIILCYIQSCEEVEWGLNHRDGPVFCISQQIELPGPD